MASIYTRQELLKKIALWKAAEDAAFAGKSYSIGNRSLTRQNIDEIRAQLKYYAEQLASLDGKAGPFFVRVSIWRP